ncbi:MULTISPECIES: glycosyltransferase [unclassified Chryseobacterium]|uniref:glycosyltransferase n=1 Tax=unclassified Chryseobacterium TaxID=2593645 RepID=UPI000D35C6C2|nr:MULTISPECIES: glycosyltransferase [unclassified Chryseobacterium]PTT69845.1 glycosyl transferase [Chryseobacterium sp. HMWF001]PVV61256.1 glycosyltransferase [Chryseobacterium sp. HMWF035]
MKKRVMFRIRSMQMGGVPKVLIDILKNLDREKFEPSVLLQINQGELLVDIPEDVKITALAKGRQEMSFIKPIRFIQLVIRNLKIQMYKVFPSLIKKKLFETPDIEIAITHSSLPDLLRSPFNNSKKVNWFHTDISWHHSKDYGKKIAGMMKKCDLTIFGSLHTRLIFEKFLDVKIYNGIHIHNTFDEKNVLEKSLLEITDINNRSLDTQKKIFVSVGRLEYQKGYDLLIEVHQELINEGYDHIIVVIGDGSQNVNLNNKVKALKLEDSFLLLGNRNNPYPYIRKADYYIQPSRYESYPIALGETLILNIPIISTDVGGVSELLNHGKTAYLVNFDKYELKTAMKKFMSNPHLVREIKNEQKKFNVENYNTKIHSKINHVLSKLALTENKK